MLGAIELTHVVLVISNGVTAAFVGGIGWLIKRTIADMDRRIAASEKRGEDLEENTVEKEEWLRESSISRQRQEKILEKLSLLEGKNQAGIEIGAAIAAALNRRSDQ